MKNFFACLVSNWHDPPHTCRHLKPTWLLSILLARLHLTLQSLPNIGKVALFDWLFCISFIVQKHNKTYGKLVSEVGFVIFFGKTREVCSISQSEILAINSLCCLFGSKSDKHGWHALEKTKWALRAFGPKLSPQAAVRWASFFPLLTTFFYLSCVFGFLYNNQRWIAVLSCLVSTYF